MKTEFQVPMTRQEMAAVMEAIGHGCASPHMTESGALPATWVAQRIARLLLEEGEAA